jgi:segregation and condensation protein A
MPEYRVQTDVYNGPMDLLLYLIKRDEIELHDIPVARITEQYCEYVDLLKVIDPNIAGDFLVMATVLMEIKSRMLLPRPVVEVGEEDDLSDPRLELVRQLLEYKKFKDASMALGEAAATQAQRWPRTPAKIRPKEPAEVDIDDVQIWDLVAAFNKVMSAIGAGTVTHDVVFDDTPISLHAADVLGRLEQVGGELGFEEIFDGRNKVEMIGLFLALLELMRQARVRVTQTAAFSSIRVLLLSAEPIEVGDEWGPTFDEVVSGEQVESPAGAADSADETPSDKGITQE